mmetsp:Transcript_34982/g.75544  ORF Transcript_34982/g.75544 Transcript_34982/m.75544 type:complete len:136 (+) Transcript_34982:207-614(+)
MAKLVRLARAASNACCTSCSLCESNADVASSSSMTLGSRSRARQMATRCFCPPDKRAPRGPTCVSQPCALWLSMKFKFAIFLHFSRWSAEAVSPSSSPYKTLSKTLASNRIGSWPTKLTCLRHHLMLSSVKGLAL